MHVNPRSIGQRVLIKVVDKLGGLNEAALRWEIAPSLLHRFVTGTAEVPDLILLRAVDLVLEEVPVLTQARLADSESQPKFEVWLYSKSQMKKLAERGIRTL